MFRSLLTPGKPVTHCTEGWVGPRAGLDRCGKSRPHRDSIPGPSSPVASRYTDCATRPNQEAGTPRFQYNRHVKMVSLSSFHTGRIYAPGNIPGTHYC